MKTINACVPLVLSASLVALLDGRLGHDWQTAAGTELCDCGWVVNIGGTSPPGQVPTFQTGGGLDGTCQMHPPDDCFIQAGCRGFHIVTATAAAGTQFWDPAIPGYSPTRSETFRGDTETIFCGADGEHREFAIYDLGTPPKPVGVVVLDATCGGCY